MMQRPEAELDPTEPDPAEPALPERFSDITRAGSPKIQPVLVGFVLATIIGMISVAGCQYPQNPMTEIIPMMVASTKPTNTG